MNAEVTPGDLLKQLGIERVVWIDDMFDDSIGHLLQAILKSPSLVKKMSALKGIVELLNEDDEPHDEAEFETALQKNLESLKADELNTLHEIIRAQAAVEEGEGSAIVSPPEDLATETAAAICKMLGIADADCKGFEDGISFINQSELDGSEKLAIIVDMQNALQGANLGEQAGLGILQAIYARSGGEMVFVLTHEAAQETEAEKESQIFGQLEAAQRFPCVISKGRLQRKVLDELSGELNVALKRSALRREVYKVGEKAQKVVAAAVQKTRDTMCKIPPEELDNAFIQRAITEGVSDLHMIERIISAQVSKSVQQMFVDDQEMHGRMRMLRGIQISDPATLRHDVIEKFRHDEIWDDGKFLAAGRAPLALGDVFETVTGDTKRRFILLGQPCDIALRKNGKRSGTVGDLLSFAEANQNPKGERSTDLLVGEGGKHLRFNFYQASPSQLNLLDLATFTEDGTVSVQSDQEAGGTLLEGQAKQLANTKKLLNAVVAAQKKANDNPKDLRRADARCKLTLRFDGHFNSICTPTFTEEGGVTKLDWNLRRTGRLRSPYVDRLMDDHMAHLGRRAFDIDYLDEATAESDNTDNGAQAENQKAAT